MRASHEALVAQVNAEFHVDEDIEDLGLDEDREE